MEEKNLRRGVKPSKKKKMIRIPYGKLERFHVFSKRNKTESEKRL